MMISLAQHFVSLFLVLLYSCLALAQSSHAAANLALHKPYTVCPLPSYSLSAPPIDQTSLTDGKYSVGRFWVQKTTVGWHPVSIVEIMIDLEKVATVGSISFNTAREASAGVNYPAQIHAFVGPDLEHLLYAGDIVDTPDNQPGGYRTKRFQLDGINVKGRYVLLEVVAPVNRGIFCDEIEVLEGELDNGRHGTFSLETVREFLPRMKWNGIERKLLGKFFAESGMSSGSLAPLPETADSHDGAVAAGMLALRAVALRSRNLGTPLLVEVVNPWSRLTPFSAVHAATPDVVLFATPLGGYDHAAFMVTNLAQDARKITVSHVKPQNGAASVSVYHVPFIRSAAMEYVADPLVPGSEFTLRPGESGVVFISVQGLREGTWRSSLRIATDGVSMSIPLSIAVSRVKLPKQQTLNAVNWGYLDFSFARDRRKQAVQDLREHHTNVMVVPPNYLQGANQVKTAGAQDFVRLESYLKFQPWADKVLLGIGLGTAGRGTVSGKVPFLSAAWKDGFRKWYSRALLAAGQAGIAESRIYIYPYDEMAGEQIDDFVRFAAWAKSEIRNIRFYATFGDETLKGKQWRKALPYLDIVQACDDEMLRDWGGAKAEAWIYDTAGMSRSLSPYSYYRLMSWKAFLRGYTGVGFWSYADIGEDVTAWKELSRDYAVIYDGPSNSILSSRRWEAWRMGVEDYELLTMYARVKGSAAAKELAKHVMENPDNATLADDARRKILTELSN